MHSLCNFWSFIACFGALFGNLNAFYMGFYSAFSKPSPWNVYIILFVFLFDHPMCFTLATIRIVNRFKVSVYIAMLVNAVNNKRTNILIFFSYWLIFIFIFELNSSVPLFTFVCNSIFILCLCNSVNKNHISRQKDKINVSMKSFNFKSII